MSHIDTAYRLGASTAQHVFNKVAQGEMPPEMMDMSAAPAEAMPEEMPPNLGDPNFWGGGAPQEGGGGGGGQPATAEEAIGLLPAGSFQGLQTKVTPDGAKTVSMKVSPDALSAPDALGAIFGTGENAKVEIASPDLAAGETSYSESRGSDIEAPTGAVPIPEATPPQAV